MHCVLFADVTILLSLTVFLNRVSETMPATSDAVPLISMRAHLEKSSLFFLEILREIWFESSTIIVNFHSIFNQISGRIFWFSLGITISLNVLDYLYPNPRECQGQSKKLSFQKRMVKFDHSLRITTSYVECPIVIFIILHSIVFELFV